MALKLVMASCMHLISSNEKASIPHLSKANFIITFKKDSITLPMRVCEIFGALLQVYSHSHPYEISTPSSSLH